MDHFGRSDQAMKLLASLHTEVMFLIIKLNKPKLKFQVVNNCESYHHKEMEIFFVITYINF